MNKEDYFKKVGRLSRAMNKTQEKQLEYFYALYEQRDAAEDLAKFTDTYINLIHVDAAEAEIDG